MQCRWLYIYIFDILCLSALRREVSRARHTTMFYKIFLGNVTGEKYFADQTYFPPVFDVFLATLSFP